MNINLNSVVKPPAYTEHCYYMWQERQMDKRYLVGIQASLQYSA